MQSAGVPAERKIRARMIDPIHQFHIHKLFTIGHIGNQEIAFTNSSAYMFGSVALISLLMIGGSPAGAGSRPHAVDRRNLLRIRRQHHKVHRRQGRHEVLSAGVLAVHVRRRVEPVGIIPYNFTVASHLIVTAALALLVFFTVLIYGFYKNGLKFFKLFVPSGIPIYILPLVVFIEVFSFFLRPISHSVRLFANMLAGHIALKVFASFVPLLAAPRLSPASSAPCCRSAW